MYYAKKRSARVLIHVASTPHHHKLSRSGWLESEQGAMEFAVGWHEAEDVWVWATRALAAISRVFQGPNAHQLYQLGGLQAALELMRHAESDKEIQLHGARAISGLVSGDLAFFGQEAPQIVSGSALETLAVTLRTFPLDARIVRAASRAVWVCVHLGRQFGQHTFVQQQIYEPLMFAMNCHLSDLKIVESCCGAVLAAAARNPDTQDKLAEAGVRDVVRDTLQSIEHISFTGTFSELSDWLFES
jgi:nucleolar protein 15